MQAKNTANGRIFFGGLNLLKPILLIGVVALTSNVNADEDEEGETWPYQSSRTYKGLTYLSVTSPHTGRIWLDRNLGATRVCEQIKDELCYGDLYQWGRAADGHQLRTSETAAGDEKAASITPGTNTFYISSSYSNFDWTHKDKKGKKRAKAWGDNGANDICPHGYRVPSLDELRDDTIDVGANNNSKMFKSGLKFPAAGYRFYQTGSVDWEHLRGALWTRNPYWSEWGNAPWATAVYYDESHLWARNENRSYGFSVRCIKD